jgi:acyl carrier protein
MKTLTEYQKIQIKEQIAKQLFFETDDLTDNSVLRDELGMDSLDAIELLMGFEKIFNCDISDELAENVITVQDVYDLISKSI